MSANWKFSCSAQPEKPDVLDVKELVHWAAEPVQAGMSIKAQIRRAANELRLDFGTVKRAWYGIAGNEIYPVIYNAWLDLVERRAKDKQEAIALAEQIVAMEKALERARQAQDEHRRMAGEAQLLDRAVAGKG